MPIKVLGAAGFLVEVTRRIAHLTRTRHYKYHVESRSFP